VEFAVIPFTIQQTNLRVRRVGDRVNLEVDMLARYVERLLTVSDPAQGPGLTMEKLRKFGFS
jgi:riboflavin synthase